MTMAHRLLESMGEICARVEVILRVPPFLDAGFDTPGPLLEGVWAEDPDIRGENLFLTLI